MQNYLLKKLAINVRSSNNYYCHHIFGSVTQGIGIYVQHVESCPSKKISGEGFDFMLQCKCSPATLPLVEEKLKAVGATSIAVNLLRDRIPAQIEYHSMNHHSLILHVFRKLYFFPQIVPPFPRTKKNLDVFADMVLDGWEILQADHPVSNYFENSNYETMKTFTLY